MKYKFRFGITGVSHQLYDRICCVLGCCLSLKRVWALRVTLSPWLRSTMDIYPTGLSSVWWQYIIYVWCGRHSLRDGTYISRALLLQLGLMGLWSNKYCHRVPRDNLQMVLALSFSHSLSFFHSSSPSRLCLASWPWSMVSSAISSFVRGQIEDRWTGRV